MDGPYYPLAACPLVAPVAVDSSELGGFDLVGTVFAELDLEGIDLGRIVLVDIDLGHIAPVDTVLGHIVLVNHLEDFVDFADLEDNLHYPDNSDLPDNLYHHDGCCDVHES